MAGKQSGEFSSKITSLSPGGPANYLSKLKPAPSRLSKLINQAALFDSQHSRVHFEAILIRADAL
jgi:hypothetical protein